LQIGPLSERSKPVDKSCIPQVSQSKGVCVFSTIAILSGSRKQYILPLLHQQLESRYECPSEKGWKQISTERLGHNPDACPVCKQLSMITLFTFDRRGPPDQEMMKELIKKHQCKQAS
jgi:hypothetical protein